MQQATREPLLFTTVVQKSHQGTTRNRAVFDFGSPFLFLFWRDKKEKAYCSNSKNTWLQIPHIRFRYQNKVKCSNRPGNPLHFTRGIHDNPGLATRGHWSGDLRLEKERKKK